MQDKTTFRTLLAGLGFTAVMSLTPLFLSHSYKTIDQIDDNSANIVNTVSFGRNSNVYSANEDFVRDAFPRQGGHFQTDFLLKGVDADGDSSYDRIDAVMSGIDSNWAQYRVEQSFTPNDSLYTRAQRIVDTYDSKE